MKKMQEPPSESDRHGYIYALAIGGNAINILII